MTTKSKTYPPVCADQSLTDALVVIFDQELRHLLAWQDKANNWDDIEGVHQIRVSLRRMRSALSLLRSTLPRGMRKTWSARMRELVEVTGPARDLDVLLEEGLPAFEARHPLAGADAFRKLVEEKRAAAYGPVRALLTSQSYADFKREFAAWIDRKGWEVSDLSHNKRKRLEANLDNVARELLHRQDETLLEQGEMADRDDPTTMHRLRIECKKLRYATEFFSYLFDAVEVFIKQLKELQDVLGAMQDTAVMGGLIDHILEGRAEPELRHYAGEFVRWRNRENEGRKQDFTRAWRDFSRAKRPW